MSYLTFNGTFVLNSTETKCSSLSRTESGGQNDPFSNGTANVRTDTGNQQLPVSNGVPKPPFPPATKMSQTFTTATAAPATSPNNNTLLSKPSTTHTENGDINLKTEKEL